MPVGHKEIDFDRSPDTTPISQYNVRITQRDLAEINHLVDRNFAGITIGWLPAAIAVTKVLQQIADIDDTLDNYDNEGACPVCKAPDQAEQDDPYD